MDYVDEQNFARFEFERHFGWRGWGAVQDKISVRNSSYTPVSRNLVCPKLIYLLSDCCEILHIARQYQSFWNFVQNTAVILPCSGQHFKTIGQLKRKIWTNEISRDFSLRYLSERYPILHNSQKINDKLCQLGFEGMWLIIFAAGTYHIVYLWRRLHLKLTFL